MLLAILIDFLGAAGRKKHQQWQTLSDGELIDLYQQTQNLQLVSILLDRHQGLIVVRTLNYLKDEEAVKDFVAELYLKLAVKLRKNSEIRDFKAWLRRMITHTLIDLSRRQKRYDTYVASLSEGVEEMDLKLALKVDSQQLSEALEQLRPLPRLYIIQHFFMGKQNAEIAREQKLDINQVRGARTRALKKLNTLLKEPFSNYFSD